MLTDFQPKRFIALCSLTVANEALKFNVEQNNQWGHLSRLILICDIAYYYQKM